MTKGFKDKDGKFHPTENSSKLSSRDVSPEGTVLESPSIQMAKILELKEKKEPNPANELGILKHRLNRGFNNGSLGTEDQRQIGNEVIEHIVNMTKKNNPKVRNWIIHSESLYNEYNDIQRALALAQPNVEKLIQWRNDGDPKTWKWKSPIGLEDPKDRISSFFTDDQNLSWVSDAYKGKMALTLMSPQEFLELASPRTARTGKRNDIRGEKFTEENIDNLTKAMMNGEPINSVYLNINKDLKVFGHEGLHRALSAMKAGIKQMPVYVYMSFDSFNDDQIKKVTRSPTSHLKPDTRF